MNNEENNNISEEVKAQEKQKSSIRVAQLHYQGPLPPAQELARYEQIQTGLVDRIVALAEKEAQHRHEMDKTWIEKAFFQRRLGQIFGLIIGIFAITAGAYVAVHGGEIAGSIIGGGGVIGLVSVFVLESKTKE